MRGFGLLLVAILVVGGGALMFWRCEGDPPTISAPESLAVGRAGGRIELKLADEGSGLREVRVSVVQGEGDPVDLGRETYPGALLAGSRQPALAPSLGYDLDAKALGLEEGPATLRVTATDWSWASFFSGNQASAEVALAVDLTPPRVAVETGLSYVQRGGAGSVVYQLDQEVARDGVMVGERFYPGHPFPSASLGETEPSRRGRRVALYAIERDAPEEPTIVVVAEDEAGNATRARWPVRYRERSFEDVTINLGSRFLNGKVPELAGELGVDASDPVPAFQDINSRVRAENEARIQEIVAGAGTERHFRGAFDQMHNSAVTSRFAEHRSYFVEKERVSEAIHYGYDLASTAAAPITAANAGRVLFADALGIYGNCVILDHGLGLTSLYAHLSTFAVAVGDPVERGQTLGRSGETGLAGGDHLHFAILVSGTYVDPKEWWDPKWVREKIESQLDREP